MEINQLLNSEQTTRTPTDIGGSDLVTEDFKKITDFFSILIKIDKRLKSKNQNENKN